MKMMIALLATFVLLFAVAGANAQDANAQDSSARDYGEKQDKNKIAKVESAELGNTKNVHQCGDLFLAGQFTQEDLDDIADAGIQRVVTLRTEGEVKWDEEKAVKERGFDFVKVPFRGPDTLNDKVFDQLRDLLNDRQKKTLLHCGSANRVGGVWLAHRVMDQGVDFETALKEAKIVGLRNEGYSRKAKEYIERRSKINDADVKGLVSGWKADVKETEKQLDRTKLSNGYFLDNVVPKLKMQLLNASSGIVLGGRQTEQPIPFSIKFVETKKIDGKVFLRGRITITEGMNKNETGNMKFTVLDKDLVKVVLVEPDGRESPTIVFRRDDKVNLNEK